MYHVFTTILITLFLVSCASTANYYTQTVDSWRGGKARRLVARWGTPYKQFMATNGSSVYIYKTKSYHQSPTPISPPLQVGLGRDNKPTIHSMPSYNNTWNRGPSSSCIAAFKADKDGVIVGTQTQGVGCYGNANFAKTMGNPDVIKI